VVVFDQRAAEGVEVRVGDLRVPADVSAAIAGMDAVVHLAGIIPPRSEENVEFSHAVNVTGTSVLVDAMQQSASCRRLVFASTASVHGARPGRTGPVTVDDPLDPKNEYAKQKVRAEEVIRASSLAWTILRVPAVPPINSLKGKHKEGTLLLLIPPDGHIEVLHPDDAGLAFANAVACDEAIGRTLLIGGGRANGCQLTGYEFATGITRAVGLGQLPRRVFGGDSAAAYNEWVDSSESQRLLDYQHHTFSDITRQLRHGLGGQYYLALVFSPLVRAALYVRSFIT
jgi:UDP-glucose 4-epimerase